MDGSTRSASRQRFAGDTSDRNKAATTRQSRSPRGTLGSFDNRRCACTWTVSTSGASVGCWAWIMPVSRTGLECTLKRLMKRRYLSRSIRWRRTNSTPLPDPKNRFYIMTFVDRRTRCILKWRVVAVTTGAVVQERVHESVQAPSYFRDGLDVYRTALYWLALTIPSRQERDFLGWRQQHFTASLLAQTGTPFSPLQPMPPVTGQHRHAIRLRLRPTSVDSQTLPSLPVPPCRFCLRLHFAIRQKSSRLRNPQNVIQFYHPYS